MRAYELAEALGGRGTGSNSYKARCPAHDDNSPSLSISDKDGKTLFHCWSGCSQQEVMNALTARELWSDVRQQSSFTAAIRPLSRGEIDEMASYILIYQAEKERGVEHKTFETEQCEQYLTVFRKRGLI